MARKRFILSIDGGGIRGLIPAVILESLEQRLRQRGKTKPLCRYFDLMAGTSTGGIIAAGLAGPNPDNASEPAATAGELVRFYVDEGNEIFHRGFFDRLRAGVFLDDEKYDAGPLETKLKDRLGQATLVRDAHTNLVLTAYDIQNRRAVFICKGREDEDDFQLWQAARATSAAPTYFEPALVRNQTTNENLALVDGGVFAADPSIAAFVEARKLDWAQHDIVMLALGTGQQNESYDYEDVRDWGPLSWIKPGNGTPIISVMMQGQASTAGYQAGYLLNLKTTPQRYFRIDGPLDGPSDALDDATPRNITALQAFASRLIAEHDGTLEHFAETLTERED